MTLRTKSTRSLALAALTLLFGVGACSDNPTGPTNAQAPRILLDRSAVMSDSHQDLITFTARVVGADGRDVAIPLEWETDNPEVLEVLGNGAFRTRANGTASVTARIPRSHPSVTTGGYFANVPDAEALVQVEQTARQLTFYGADEVGGPGGGGASITAIDIWAIDQIVGLAAAPADRQGQVVSTQQLSGLTWSSDDESVFTVDADGNLTPVGNGETTIRVSGDGLSGSVLVRVRASQDIRACARMRIGGTDAPAVETCSTLRLTFTRGG